MGRDPMRQVRRRAPRRDPVLAAQPILSRWWLKDASVTPEPACQLSLVHSCSLRCLGARDRDSTQQPCTRPNFPLLRFLVSSLRRPELGSCACRVVQA